MKRFLLLIPLLCVLLSGCGEDAAGIFRCDIENPVHNLDPQFATSPEAKMIIGNLYEGLVVRQPTGEIIPGIAHSWDISQDGLSYTFYLREGLHWPDDDETPLTAGDFSFALYRLFDPDAPSPHAEDFAAIRGSRARLAGRRDALIGVLPRGNHTLLIELERPDPRILEKLASTAAMPCNPAFFAQSRGRYGLETRFVLGNGPFNLAVWDNERFIQLARNEAYHSPNAGNIPGSARFYIGREDPVVELEAGRSDFAEVPSGFAAAARRMGLVMGEIVGGERVWAIAFNMRDLVWRTTLLRRAVAASIGGSDYFEYDVEEAARLFAMGAELAEIPLPPQFGIHIPDTGGHMQYMAQLQQDWQAQLSFFPRLHEMPADALRRRLLSGDYQAMLMAFEMRNLPAQFRSGSAENRTGYRNPVYDMFLDRAKNARTLEEMSANYSYAQSQLLSDAPIIPLYIETAWYAVTKEAEPFAWVYLGGRNKS